MRNLLLAGASLAAFSLAGVAHAGTFTNGGFETGDFSGWTQGGGYWYGGAYPDPSLSQYQIPGDAVNSITSAGFDPLTNNNVSTVYNGAHAAKVNDSANNYSVSQISQTVTNYSDPTIAFAYAAVLQSSHGPTDSDAFIIKLTDLTTNTVVYQNNVNSATAEAGLFKQGAFYNGSYWYYTDWTPISVAVTAGDDFQLSLLANDCPYGGHAGYAYLDGFGAVVPPPGPVPEPGTWALMLAGVGFTGSVMRRQRQRALA